jgi:hypothetical protein
VLGFCAVRVINIDGSGKTVVHKKLQGGMHDA